MFGIYRKKSIFYVPATTWGGAYSFTLVRRYVRPSVRLFSTVLVSATPPKVFDAGTSNLKHSSDMH